MGIQRPIRIPFSIVELHGYSVDAEGQVWRIGGTRTGRDRPLNGLGFTEAMRAWEARGSPGGRRVLLVMPGVWRYCRESTPGASENRMHRHRDAMGFRLYFMGALGPEYQDAANAVLHAASHAWFVVRSDASCGDPLLVAGPVAFVALCRNHPDSGLHSG
jgi:hypothetical protein